MIGQATAHRRANAFAQALEDAAVLGDADGEHRSGGFGGRQDDPGAPGPGSGQGGPGTHGPAGHGGGGHGAHAAARHADPEQAGMLALAAAIGGRPRPVMDAERKAVQRAQLIAAMEQAIADGSFATADRVPEQRTESGGQGSHRLRKLGPRSRLSRRLAAGGLTVGVAAGAFGGVAAASTNALPGDHLYGLKRGMEDLKLDLAGGNASRGEVYLDMAATRMQEARRLMDRGRSGTLDEESVSEVRKALSGMHQEASEGHRLLTQAYNEDGSLQPIELLDSFSKEHRQGWTDLRGKLPTQLTDVSEQVSSVFDAIDQEVAPLQSLLPKAKDHRSGGGRHAEDDSGTGSATPGSTPSGTASASPSTPTSSDTPSGAPGTDGSTAPSPTATAPNGLIGGSGNLLDPPTTTPTGTDATPTDPTTPPRHSVILPPLLPGLLPGLGLGGDDDPE